MSTRPIEGIHPLFSLEGKTALITGATRGIGLGIARCLAMAGAKVLVSSESPADCYRVAAALQAEGLRADAMPADMSRREQVLELAARVERAGGVQVLVCNAGVSLHNGPLHRASEEDWDRTMTINLRSAHWLTSALAPQMADLGGGSIVLMASLSAMRGNRSIGLYGMSKAALAQLARNLAVEWGPAGVRANAIAPGLIDTELAKPFHADPELLARRMVMTPLRRMGKVDEVAAVALLLASAGGAFITGQTLVVDGGTLITDGS
ncbi:SDR family NAD(P)-dependent oxidoreductase [Parathalassolituus penaei]|uniref:Glucose 1-dehydrogenase n=1 Tax=Parathalassolituus penaei TaxID=2997323 RepID=A0A9X3EIC9_9GAMM|nr:glucose 1-dehydrogenase [Parathalassolituus penaei]MCY0967270.1 glucose 1-dehydrogenase [Parathalassolituus penaei]